MTVGIDRATPEPEHPSWLPRWHPSPLQREREAFRRSRARRSLLAAGASTVLVGVAVWIALTHAPGWGRVQNAFLNPGVARAYFPDILSGLWLNVRVLAVAEVLVLALSLVIAAVRTLRGPVFFPLRLAATIYVDLFRGLPLIIVLYLIGYGIPGLRLSYLPNSPNVLGTIALVLTYCAYVSEVFRAGMESVHPSQRAAARSLGLTYAQTLRLVVLPQAVRRVVPPLLNDFVSLQKDVGLISVLGAVDAVRQAQIAQSTTYNFTPYVVAGLLFVALAVPSARLADWATSRARSREQSAGTV